MDSTWLLDRERDVRRYYVSKCVQRLAAVAQQDCTKMRGDSGKSVDNTR